MSDAYGSVLRRRTLLELFLRIPLMILETVVIASKAVAILLPLAGFSLYIFAIYRTGSAHIVFYRIWEILTGKRPLSNPIVAKYIEDQRSLTSFIFFSGIRPKTLNKATNLISWAEERDLDLNDVARSGRYFDISKLRVDSELLPKKPAMVALSIILFAISLLTLIFTIFGISTPRAYLSFKDNGQWFSLTEDRAKAIFSGATSNLTSDTCKLIPKTPDHLLRTGFNKEQAESICEFFAGGDANAQIKDYLQSQRIGVLIILITASLLLILPARILGTILNAKKLNLILAGTTHPVETVIPTPSASQVEKMY